MDEQFAELIKRIDELESQLKAIQATGVVAPEGDPAPEPSQGGAPLFSNQLNTPSPPAIMERVGAGSESTWRPVGNFETPEQLQQAAQQAHANITPQQLASAPVAPSHQVQPLPQPPAQHSPPPAQQPAMPAQLPPPEFRAPAGSQPSVLQEVPEGMPRQPQSEPPQFTVPPQPPARRPQESADEETTRLMAELEARDAAGGVPRASLMDTLPAEPQVPPPRTAPAPPQNRPYTPEEIERQQAVSRDVGRLENETSYESSVAFADAGNAHDNPLIVDRNLAKTNAMQEERSIGNTLASGANQGGYQPDEEQSAAEQVQQRAAMKAEQRRERMRSKGQTPHIDRFDDAYRSEAYGAAGIPEPSRLPPTPGTAAHQQQSGGFDAIGQFAEFAASSMLLMNARIHLAMQQIEELRRDMELGGNE